MISLYYERRHNVVMTKISGVLSSEDLDAHDLSVLLFLAGLMAGERPVRGLYDFSEVVALAVPVSRINQRGQRPAIIEGQRVVVAPPGAAGAEWAARLAEQRRAAGHSQPTIVATLEEAYRLLDLDNPQFDLADPAL
ncbi:MAG: hypothetical protein WCP68_15825 [Enhydrobacter sp.]